MTEAVWNALTDRPPITEGWHLLLMLAVGVAVVALVHRRVKRQVALLRRRDEARDLDHERGHAD